ncbi:MAG: glycosyl hydrolase [Mobilicoccus sp.]|nr:glycosyl hydrolase [Mobilicoccus sp.]
MKWRVAPGIAAAAMTALLLTACTADPQQPSPAPTRTPFTPPPGSPELGTQSGLLWDSGVVHNEADLSEEFEQLRGKPLDVIGVAPTRDSWKELLNAWWLTDMSIPPDFEGTLNVALPLFPADGSMADAASGADNEKWEQMGRLIAEKYPTAYVRPGWEFNIRDWDWAVTKNNVEEYKQGFRNASTSLKKGGPDLRIVFNPNAGKGNSLADARLAYPGDDVVDIIGIDAYDWSPPYDDGRGWERHRTQAGGWDFWGDFARERGKQFAVPEWGVITGSPDSGGDNPHYINKVMGWMRENADIMAFDTYFDEREAYCTCSLTQNPRAKEAYLEQLQGWVDPSPRPSTPTAPGTAEVGDGTPQPEVTITPAQPTSP